MLKLNPWTPTFFAFFLLFTGYFESRANDSGMPFIYAFLPMIVWQVSWFFAQLQKDNDELRARLDALEGKTNAEELPENRAVAPG